MPEKHPYMPGSGGLIKAVTHLRKSFPAQVDAKTLKKLGIAPNNETYVINILRFINVIDDKGKRTSEASAVFMKHSDEDFQDGLSEMVKTAYGDLFSLHGDGAWTLPLNDLISYFRSTDQTSAIVGQRQAGTFQALAGMSGHVPVPAKTSAKSSAQKPARKPSKVSAKKTPRGQSDSTQEMTEHAGPDVGLTVRIEINLPASGDQETYDRIFESIRKNFLNG